MVTATIRARDFSKHAEVKLAEFLHAHPEAKVSGLLLHVGENSVVITNEGRIEWHKQNHLGGINAKVHTDADVDLFGHSIVNRKHR